jgi:predicted AlkP superfamily pyrophosphatase or phosphodiesterase
MKRLAILLGILWGVGASGADYVINVSVDGLGSSYLQALIEAGKLPHFKQLAEQGAGTTNARTDYDITVTLPNHTSMVTSRPIKGEAGHGWALNTDPAKGMTLHSRKGSYVAGVFDVAHDNGCRTGLWSTKTKFSLFRDAYDADHGAPDTTGVDNGRRKLDVFVYLKSSAALTDSFIQTMATNPCQYAFLHYGEGDGAGHAQGWGSDAYNAALMTLDECLGRVMDLMTNATLKGRGTLIVTADHGGKDRGHGEAVEPLNYTIPLYVFGAGVAAGELYAFNQGVRAAPGTGRPDFAAHPPPIRNGEVGNLALALLGFGPIPGSSLNVRQDLRVGPLPPR